MIDRRSADCTQHDVCGSRGAMNVEAHLHQAVNDVLDLFFLRTFLHHHNHSVRSLVFLLAFETLDPPALINNPLEQTLETLIVEWAAVRLLDPAKNFALPL